MNNFCLLPNKVNDFRKALKEKEITIPSLLNMTSEARTTLLREYAGDAAPQVNELFESKLVLKNRMIGIKNWASKMGEIGKYSEQGKADLAKKVSEYRAKQQERIFSPKENEAFLNDLANKEIGAEITQEEARQVFELSKKTEDLFKEYDSKTETWSSDKAAADYGASKVIYQKYVDNLKTGDIPLKGMVKEYTAEVKNLWKENKPKAVAKVLGDSVTNLSNTMINAVASWDNSFMGRQGAITLVKSPKIWFDMAKKSMVDVYQTFRGKNPQDILMAQVYSDPDFINGNYKKAKITFGIEEEVPTKIMEKIPVLGKIFKASDVAFTDSAIRARMGLFKMFKKVYEKTDLKMTDPILTDIGTMTNAITARGNVGQIGTSKPVRVLMWAPRMLKADWDILTGHTFGAGLETGFGRKQAAKTITGVVIATAAVLAVAKALGAKVETDPRSSDFLSMKIGDTRIKVPFARGMPQIVTLFARIATKQSKSATTGVISKLNTGDFGSRTSFDVGVDFLVNKTTPPAGLVIDWFKGEMFGGKKLTPKNVGVSLLPISVQNFIQLKDQDGVAAVGAFLDLFGVSTNTYSVSTDWSQNPGVELKQFKEKVGEEKFKKANEEFNAQFAKRLKDLQASVPQFKNKSEEDKQKAVTKLKDEIKAKIFREYGFKYKK